MSPEKIVTKVDDPIVKVKEYTDQEYEQGNTKNLREYADERGIDLD